jgi:phosphoribosylformylglycinamidine cyclo-ligase
VTTYRASGVDLEAADELVALVGPHVTATWNDRVVGGFGGFAAGIRLPSGYRTPVLMMSTDGVGTKADIAAKTSILGGLGWDLLAMVADDLAAAGAAPFAVQDYIATGRLAPSRIAMLVESLAAACAENGVALLGGETAEHPGVLGPDEFDLAATALGIVEEGDVVDGSAIEPGDVLLGVESPNLRSNGFSLVRNVITDRLDLDAPFPGDDRPTAEVLLEPSVRTRDRRRPARQRGSRAPAGMSRRDRAKPLGSAQRVRSGPATRRRHRRGDVPRLQHGNRIRRRRSGIRHRREHRHAPDAESPRGADRKDRRRRPRRGRGLIATATPRR